MDVLSVKLADGTRTINGVEYQGYFREFIKVYKVGSRRLDALRNVTSRGEAPYKKQRLDLPPPESKEPEHIKVPKVPGYSITINYHETSTNLPPGQNASSFPAPSNNQCVTGRHQSVSLTYMTSIFFISVNSVTMSNFILGSEPTNSV